MKVSIAKNARILYVYSGLFCFCRAKDIAVMSHKIFWHFPLPEKAQTFPFIEKTTCFVCKIVGIQSTKYTQNRWKKCKSSLKSQAECDCQRQKICTTEMAKITKRGRKMLPSSPPNVAALAALNFE